MIFGSASLKHVTPYLLTPFTMWLLTWLCINQNGGNTEHSLWIQAIFILPYGFRLTGHSVLYSMTHGSVWYSVLRVFKLNNFFLGLSSYVLHFVTNMSSAKTEIPGRHTYS